MKAKWAATIFINLLFLAGLAFLVLFYWYGAGHSAPPERKARVYIVGGLLVVHLIVGRGSRINTYGLLDLVAWMRKRRREAQGQAAQARAARLCRNCGYDRIGLAANVKCPECGVAPSHAAQ